MTKTDPLMIGCGSHGERIATVVCKHMLKSEPAPAGFVENNSDPADLQAWCYRCEEKFQDEEGMTDAFKEFNGMVIVCVVCYSEAKTHHMVALS